MLRGFLNPFLCGFKISRIFLNADKVAPEVLTGDAAGAAPHTRIQNGIAFIRVGPDHVCKEVNRLLGRVDLACVVAIRKGQNVARASVAVVYGRDTIKAPVIPGSSCASESSIRLARCFLRMIRRQVLVKDENIFVGPERHAVGIEKAYWHRFVPYPLVTIPPAIAVY